MDKNIDKTGNLAEAAKGLSKNPMGIIALFIVLAYGMATLVIMTAFTTYTDTERLLLICFIVFFPVLLLIVFVFLLIFHSEKLRGEERKRSPFVEDSRKQTKNDSNFEESEPLLKKRQRRK